MRKILILLFAFLVFGSAADSNIQDEELQKEFECMAQNLHHEARGETQEGIIAVANVVLNRLNSKRFPDTICGIIYQKNQFSWVGKKHISIAKIAPHIKKIAYDAIVNETLVDNTRGSLFFKTRFSLVRWDRQKLSRTIIIGNHEFYR